MKIKYTIMFTIIGILVGFISSPALAKDPFQRQDRQKDRIQQGIKSGEITRHELLRLKNEQKRIRRYTQKAVRDGRLSRHERRTIDRMQDKAGQHIYKAKHNRNYQHRGHNRYDRQYRYNSHGKYNRHYRYDRQYRYYDKDRCNRSHRRYSGRYPSHSDGYYFSGTWYEPGGFFSFSTGGKW